MLNAVINNMLLRIVQTTAEIIPDAAYTASTGLSTSPFETPPLLKMLLGLAAILLLIFFLAWLSRKMKLVQSTSNGYQIKSLATLPLTTREKLTLIEVGGKQVLLGISPGRINKLHVFDDAIKTDTDSTVAANENQFSSHFKKALGLSDTKGEQI